MQAVVKSYLYVSRTVTMVHLHLQTTARIVKDRRKRTVEVTPCKQAGSLVCTCMKPKKKEILA
jgi:hypothetical protein